MKVVIDDMFDLLNNGCELCITGLTKAEDKELISILGAIGVEKLVSLLVAIWQNSKNGTYKFDLRVYKPEARFIYLLAEGNCSLKQSNENGVRLMHIFESYKPVTKLDVCCVKEVTFYEKAFKRSKEPAPIKSFLQGKWDLEYTVIFNNNEYATRKISVANKE